MKSAAEQLSTYKSVHLNKANIKTHFIGVPLIVWSVMTLLNLVALPMKVPGSEITLNLAMVLIAVTLVYYFLLNFKLALGIVLFIVPLFYIAYQMSLQQHATYIAIGVFAIGWVFQFIGHYYEKAKPAFFDDIKQLLIGPFFLMSEIYFMLGLQPQLEKTITPMAIDKRRQLELAKNT